MAMKVGFYLVQGDSADGYVMADMLLRSVRQAMPGVEVAQFTDLKSPAVYGVDHLLRKPAAPLALLRSLHQASVEGEWLFIDTDAIVRQDVRHVFAHRDFDLALADRSWPHLEPMPDFAAVMPWNIGVVFSRCPSFWRAVHEALLKAPEKAQDFMGDQFVACELLKTGRWTLHELPGIRFNYPPKDADDAGLDAAIVHFKGHYRKPWMLQRFADYAVAGRSGLLTLRDQPGDPEYHH